jgi:hypothetical protein
LDKNLFDGVEKHLAELKSWEWIFGKTPPFSIERTFYSKRNNMNVLNVNVDVTKGRIHNLKLEELNILNNTKVGRSFLTLRIGLEETKLCPNEVRKNLSNVKMEWIAQQVYTVQTHEYLDWVLQCVMETFAIFSERREP